MVRRAIGDELFHLRMVRDAAAALLKWHRSEHFKAVAELVQMQAVRGYPLPEGYEGCGELVDEFERELDELGALDVE